MNATITTTSAATARYFKGADLIEQTHEVTYPAEWVVYHGAGVVVRDDLVVTPVMGDFYMVLGRGDVTISQFALGVKA